MAGILVLVMLLQVLVDSFLDVMVVIAPLMQSSKLVSVCVADANAFAYMFRSASAMNSHNALVSEP